MTRARLSILALALVLSLALVLALELALELALVLGVVCRPPPLTLPWWGVDCRPNCL